MVAQNGTYAIIHRSGDMTHSIQRGKHEAIQQPGADGRLRFWGGRFWDARFPERALWVRLTEEPFPRLSVVRRVRPGVAFDAQL